MRYAAKGVICFNSSHDERKFSATNPPQWPSHYLESLEEFHDIIDGRAPEAQIHNFLEQHPYFLPGLDAFHHGPFAGVVATKFCLGNDFQTDFAYVTSNSQTLGFTCVEIESARKRLFRKDNKFHRDYIDARQQISDWLFWAHHNIRSALDCWGRLFKGYRLRDFAIGFRGILVMGRREDFTNNQRRKERWAGEAQTLDPQLSTMTYDRLIEQATHRMPDMDNEKLVVCNFRERTFCAKHICD